MLEKKLNWILFFLACCFTAGFFYIQNSPSREHSFDPSLVDDGLVSFKNLEKAKVLEVIQEDFQQTKRLSRLTQELRVKILSGEEKNQEAIAFFEALTPNQKIKFKTGETILLGKIDTENETEYIAVDKYRIPQLYWLAAIFLTFAIFLSGKKGLGAILGLLLSFFILWQFAIPNIISGKNPLITGLVCCGSVGLVSIFLAHGYNSKSKIAAISTTTCLFIAFIIGHISILWTKIYGTGNIDAEYLQNGFSVDLNLSAILLIGFIIGALGVLDDITTGQAAIVEELNKANPSLNFKELFVSASNVGKEHISSLVNTLVLAYAGTAMPILLLLKINSVPIWQNINSETVAEEITRSVIGGMALMLAVPLTTALASYFLPKLNTKKNPA